MPPVYVLHFTAKTTTTITINVNINNNSNNNKELRKLENWILAQF
jgi:hypothetical protein